MSGSRRCFDGGPGHVIETVQPGAGRARALWLWSWRREPRSEMTASGGWWPGEGAAPTARNAAPSSDFGERSTRHSAALPRRWNAGLRLGAQGADPADRVRRSGRSAYIAVRDHRSDGPAYVAARALVGGAVAGAEGTRRAERIRVDRSFQLRDRATEPVVHPRIQTRLHGAPPRCDVGKHGQCGRHRAGDATDSTTSLPASRWRLARRPGCSAADP